MTQTPQRFEHKTHTLEKVIQATYEHADKSRALGLIETGHTASRYLTGDDTNFIPGTFAELTATEFSVESSSYVHDPLYKMQRAAAKVAILYPVITSDQDRIKFDIGASPLYSASLNIINIFTGLPEEEVEVITYSPLGLVIEQGGKRIGMRNSHIQKLGNLMIDRIDPRDAILVVPELKAPATVTRTLSTRFSRTPQIASSKPAEVLV